MIKFPRLTIFGRALLLMICEVAANAICWAVAGILFARSNDTRPTLGLALLAWTLGLRHALDADHISKGIWLTPVDSAIDNATRCLINIEQFPVTCGLFFSLGHSTIVIIVTVAIAISSSVYEKIHGVGEVGGIIGAAVSGSFMFIIGLANSIILWKIIKRRREDKLREQRRSNGDADVEDVQHLPKEDHMLMMRILGPIINFVNRPWKMYPVGVLFGLGFDTASSIALLAVSALAKRDSDGHSIPSSHIVILPLLFTAGMTLIDSADSVLMLYSYSGIAPWPAEILTWEPRQPKITGDDKAVDDKAVDVEADPKTFDLENDVEHPETDTRVMKEMGEPSDIIDHKNTVDAQKLRVMSGLSIILTMMSILVAFSISLITIVGLIGEQCASCITAAEEDDGHGGGFAGRWWRAWAAAGEQSGYIGIGIVGGFVLIVAVWYGGKSALRRIKKEKV